MWHFAIGLYLVELTPGSLRLTAIYQLVSTLSIIIFGPLVGDWVDANPRLKGTCSSSLHIYITANDINMQCLILCFQQKNKQTNKTNKRMNENCIIIIIIIIIIIYKHT